MPGAPTVASLNRGVNHLIDIFNAKIAAIFYTCGRWFTQKWIFLRWYLDRLGLGTRRVWVSGVGADDFYYFRRLKDR
jgi:hypothetical protein